MTLVPRKDRSSSSSKKSKATQDDKEILKDDLGKFIMTGLAIVAMGTLVLHFLRALIYQKFLVNFSVDALVGVASLVFLYVNFRSKYRLLSTYPGNARFYLYDLLAFGISIAVKLLSPLPLDFSLVILFAFYYLSKRYFNQLLDI